jgi:hypothetical protein
LAGGSMKLSLVWIPLAAGLVAGPLPIRAALAQGNPPGTVTFSSAVTGIHQLPGDLACGGDLQWSSVSASVGITRQFVPAFAAGLSLRYDGEDWPIGAAAAFSGDSPWRRLQRAGASANLSLALSRTLLTGVSPTIEWAGTPGTGGRDGLVYGAVLSVANAFSPRFVLGGGASVTRQFYSVKTTPFVIVNWRITDRLRIANASAAGPEGGAGVELCCSLSPAWELAGGGVYRSDRWRLDADGRYPGDVGETSSIPLLARLTRRIGPGAKVDLYAGVSSHSRITVKDSGGRVLAHDDYGIVPLVSMTLSGRFQRLP